MLLHCDIVYAADDTRFRLPFVNLGVCPEGASSLLLPTVTGHRVASELLLFGDFFDCESARLCGLVNRSMPAQELLDYTLKRALQLSNQPQKALLESKRLTKSHTYDAIKACLLDEARVFGQLLKTEESLAIREKMLG